MRTFYVVPAQSDIAGQCRIVASDEPPVPSARESYRRDPDRWAEVGLMNSSGQLVCFDGSAEELDAVLACVPLAGGLVIRA